MKKFEYTPPEQPRELILKLGQKITDRIGHTVTAEDPEYYGLEALVTDEMAEVALKMKVRKPMTLAQAVKATGKEEKVLEELGESETREAVCPSDVCTGKCRVF